MDPNLSDTATGAADVDTPAALILTVGIERMICQALATRSTHGGILLLIFLNPSRALGYPV